MAIRKTNRGVPIDMDALMAASDRNSPAVGNMRVNAKGDVVEGGTVVKKNEDRVREFYRQNPKSSTSHTSLKGDSPSKLQPDMEPPKAAEPKTASTGKANKKAKAKKVDAPVVDEFDDVGQEPLGYKERELPNGDIEMVPYYREEDK